jgi:hypothetical protein
MAGLALQSSMYDDYGLPWTIYIYDTDARYLGNYEFNTAKGSIVLTDEGDDNDPFRRIIAKKLTFTMVMYTDQYTSLQKAAIINFYTDLVTSPEGRYYVRLMQGSETKFNGKLLADIGDLTLTYHKDLTLTATDGILQLKDIEYRPTGYDDTLPIELVKVTKFKDHFTNILKNNDVTEVFYTDIFSGTTDPLFTTSHNWTHATVSGDIFDTVAKKNNYYNPEEETDQKKASASYRKYFSCYDVMEDLLTGFNMRMIYSDGCYHIEALGYQDNLTVVRYAYNYAGTSMTSPGNKTTHDITTNDDIYVLADPAIRYMPPFKAVTLRQNKKYNNVLAGLNIWYHRTDADNRGPHDMGYIIGEASQLVFDLRFDLDITMPGSATDYFGVEFEISIQIGSYYLKNNPITDNYMYFNLGESKFNTKEYLWTATPSTFKMILPSSFSSIYVQFQNSAAWDKYWSSFVTWPITGLSDAIPADGECYVELVGWKALNKNDTSENATLTPNLVQWTIDKRSRIYIVTNGEDGLTKVPDNTIIYEVGDPRNSIVYDTKLSYFDAEAGLGFLNFQALWLSFGGGSYAFTTEWTDADMGDTLPIQELVIKQMLGMRKAPNKVVRLTMLRSDDIVCHMDDRYAIGSDLYIPLRMSHNIDSGTYQMSLWAPVKDYAGINITRFTDIEDINRLVPSFADPQRGSSDTITYYERFADVNDTYVEMAEDMIYYTSDSATKEYIDATWNVWVQGVRQDYVDRETLTFPLTGGELIPGQYTINTEENRFYFAFNESNVIVIKFTKL